MVVKGGHLLHAHETRRQPVSRLRLLQCLLDGFHIRRQEVIERLWISHLLNADPMSAAVFTLRMHTREGMCVW